MKKSRVKTCVDRQRKNVVEYQRKKKEKKSEEKETLKTGKKAFKCSGFSAAQSTKWFNKF